MDLHICPAQPTLAPRFSLHRIAAMKLLPTLCTITLLAAACSDANAPGGVATGTGSSDASVSFDALASDATKTDAGTDAATTDTANDAVADTTADTTPPGPDVVLVPFEGKDLLKQYCPALMKAECEARKACGTVESVDDCLKDGAVNTAEGECEADNKPLEAAVTKGQVAYDLGKVKACMGTSLQWNCGKGTESFGMCAFKAVQGKKKPGDKCAVDEECWPNAYCHHVSGATECTGTCKAYNKAGESCNTAQGGALCAWGLYCDKVKICQARVAASGACTDPGSCLAGLLCIDKKCAPRADVMAKCPKGADEGCTFGSWGCTTADDGSQTCVPSFAVWVGKGKACDPEGVAVTGPNRHWCKTPYWCDPATKTCAAGDAVGTPCTNKEEAKCGPTQQCADEDPKAGKCGPLPKLGEYCNEICVAPFACSKHNCIERLPAGSTCTKGDECQSDKCTDKKCTAICEAP
jgi:hypothetical protein